MPADPQPTLIQVTCPQCGGGGCGPSAACSLCEGWGYVWAPRATAECPRPTRPEEFNVPDQPRKADWPGETSE